jgi:cellulose biosynthesis protein BcsQ
MLRLAIETVAHDYDVIVIDSAITLSIGTINVVCAADVLIVPTLAELFDYLRTAVFDMLRDLLRTWILKASSQMSVFCLPNTVIIWLAVPVDGRTNSDAWEAWSLKMLCAKRMKSAKVRSV